MSQRVLQTPYTIRVDLAQIAYWIDRYWFQAILIALGYYILFHKDVSVEFGMSQNAGINYATTTSFVPPNSNETPIAGAEGEEDAVNRLNTSIIETPKKEKAKKKKKWKDRKANNFHNITFILSPDYGERKGIDPAIVQQHLDNCNDYVERYASVAIEEMRKFGIPASITLAQGLLESDAAGSRLAQESNNHFGIKCKSKCKGCTCRNYSDDDVYDMFRVFESPWESFREHSLLLKGKRYSKLFQLELTDYKAWAHGLKKAGYATDKRYAYKLIQIVEELKLYRYDRMVNA